MLTSYLAMQNTVLANNLALTSIVNSTDRMLNAVNSVSFGNSQPLKPTFTSLSNDELNIKANETRIAVLQKLSDALNKKLSKDIAKSAPKYAGLNYLA